MTTHTRYDSSLRFVTVCLAVAVALGTVGVVAATPPTPPHQVYGTVTDQNGDAVGSVSVQLVYDGTVVNETTTDADGYYEFKVPDPDDEASDERLTLVVSGTDTGDEVTWTAAGTTEVEVTVETGDTSTTTKDDSNDDSDDSNADYDDGDQKDQSDRNDESSTDQTTVEERDDTSEGAVDDESTATKTATVEPPETATTADATTTDATSEATTTTTDGGSGAIPGFGAGVALVALVATGLLAVHRPERNER